MLCTNQHPWLDVVIRRTCRVTCQPTCVGRYGAGDSQNQAQVQNTDGFRNDLEVLLVSRLGGGRDQRAELRPRRRRLGPPAKLVGWG